METMTHCDQLIGRIGALELGTGPAACSDIALEAAAAHLAMPTTPGGGYCTFGRVACTGIDDNALEGTAIVAGPTINRIGTRCYAPAINDGALEAVAITVAGPTKLIGQTCRAPATDIDDGALEAVAITAAGPTINRIGTRCYAPAIDDGALESAALSLTMPTTPQGTECKYFVARTAIDDGALEGAATVVTAGPTQLRVQTFCGSGAPVLDA